MASPQILGGERRCEDYDVQPNTYYHAHDLPRCPDKGVKHLKGKWLCEAHAERVREATADLVHIEPGRCPTCGAPTVREQVQEQPLLRHGGYGAARRTVTEHCENRTCGWWLTTDISEERPRAHP